MDLDAAKRAKKALTTKPKWSFGSIRYWPSKKKCKKGPTFKSSEMPELSHIAGKTKSPSKISTKLFYLLLGVIAIGSLLFPDLFISLLSLGGFFIGLPILFIAIFKSLRENHQPKCDYKVKERK